MTIDACHELTEIWNDRCHFADFNSALTCVLKQISQPEMKVNLVKLLYWLENTCHVSPGLFTIMTVNEQMVLTCTFCF